MRLRRLLVVALAVAPFTAAVAYGCSSSESFQSACLWMADPQNCFAQFHDDMLANKDASPVDNPTGDCSGPGSPTEASPGAPGNPNGVFLMRTPLAQCFFDLGGSVTIAPPIDLTMWPPSEFADPVTYTFTIMAPNGDTCGTATYTSPHGFSINIMAPPDAGTTTMAVDGGSSSSSSSSSSGASDAGPPPIPYGTYLQSIPPGRDAFDVLCPSGASYTFDIGEVIDQNGNPTPLCPRYADILPQASFQVYVGGIDVNGAVSLAIDYPPSNPAVYGDAGLDAGPPLQPDHVVYFNCTIPAAPETCNDGVKDGTETDIDCGGPQIYSKCMCGTCPPRCQMMQQCLCDGDCAAGNTCQSQEGTGMLVCTPGAPDSGTGRPCFYNPDAGAPCDGGSAAGCANSCLPSGNTCTANGQACCSGVCSSGTCM